MFRVILVPICLCFLTIMGLMGGQQWNRDVSPKRVKVFSCPAVLVLIIEDYSKRNVAHLWPTAQIDKKYYSIIFPISEQELYHNLFLHHLPTKCSFLLLDKHYLMISFLPSRFFTLSQIISAAQTLALHPSSKIAKENLEVFCEAWESQLCDMGLLLREINDVYEGRRGAFFVQLMRTHKK